MQKNRRCNHSCRCQFPGCLGEQSCNPSQIRNGIHDLSSQLVIGHRIRIFLFIGVPFCHKLSHQSPVFYYPVGDQRTASPIVGDYIFRLYLLSFGFSYIHQAAGRNLRRHAAAYDLINLKPEGPGHCRRGCGHNYQNQQNRTQCTAKCSHWVSFSFLFVFQSCPSFRCLIRLSAELPYHTAQRKGGSRGRGYTGAYNNVGSRGDSGFNDVRSLIMSGRIADAEQILNGVPPERRNAEWYFLKGSVLYRRGWLEEAKDHFSRACQMDPGNAEYSAALNQAMNQGSGVYGGYRPNTNMNAGGCNSCDVCSSLICADCCCECMGGDLISCC